MKAPHKRHCLWGANLSFIYIDFAILLCYDEMMENFDGISRRKKEIE